MVSLSYSIDSREVKEGDTFFALKGVKVDGHDFLQQVAKAGAEVAVVSKEYAGPDFGLTLIRVSNVLHALQESAKSRLRRLNCSVVGITGTVGKTTTKDFVTSLLSKRYRVHASHKSYNSQITLPLTILQTPDGTEVLVLEMAMSEPGQIRRLCEIAPPTVACLLSVQPNCGKLSMEEIANAKAEIFENAKQKIVAADLKIKGDQTFSLTPPADYWLEEVKNGVLINGQHFCPWNIPGRHNLHNFLGAVAIARAFDLSWEEIARAKLALPAGRLQIEKKLGLTIINDTYNNACAASAIAALDSFPKTSGKKIAVLSEMVDIGHFSKSSHLEVAKHALSKVDVLLCIGKEAKPMYDLWENEGRVAHWFASREQLLNQVKQLAKSGDVVLFKGSRSYALEQLIEAL